MVVALAKIGVVQHFVEVAVFFTNMTVVKMFWIRRLPFWALATAAYLCTDWEAEFWVIEHVLSEVLGRGELLSFQVLGLCCCDGVVEVLGGLSLK